jgi:hypothetical protein
MVLDTLRQRLLAPSDGGFFAGHRHSRCHLGRYGCQFPTIAGSSRSAHLWSQRVAS